MKNKHLVLHPISGETAKREIFEETGLQTGKASWETGSLYNFLQEIFIVDRFVGTNEYNNWFY